MPESSDTYQNVRVVQGVLEFGAVYESKPASRRLGTTRCALLHAAAYEWTTLSLPTLLPITGGEQRWIRQ